MKTQDNEQYSTPKTKPKRKSPEPRAPGSDREKEIRQGATEADQLMKLKPEHEDPKAPYQLGRPPVEKVNKGE